MPILRIELLDGRSEEMKLALIQEVTDAVARSLNIGKEEVDIILKEVKRTDWVKGGVPWPWGRHYD